MISEAVGNAVKHAQANRIVPCVARQTNWHMSSYQSRTTAGAVRAQCWFRVGGPGRGLRPFVERVKSTRQRHDRGGGVADAHRDRRGLGTVLKAWPGSWSTPATTVERKAEDAPTSRGRGRGGAAGPRDHRRADAAGPRRRRRTRGPGTCFADAGARHSAALPARRAPPFGRARRRVIWLPAQGPGLRRRRLPRGAAPGRHRAWHWTRRWSARCSRHSGATTRWSCCTSRTRRARPDGRGIHDVGIARRSC